MYNFYVHRCKCVYIQLTRHAHACSVQYRGGARSATKYFRVYRTPHMCRTEILTLDSHTWGLHRHAPINIHTSTHSTERYKYILKWWLYEGTFSFFSHCLRASCVSYEMPRLIHPGDERPLLSLVQTCGMCCKYTYVRM